MASQESPFIIRVYGIFFNEINQLLVSDEFFLDTPMIKFPGGGLEFGEGPKDCLIREINEELQEEIVNINHYYTTDYYQKALYYKNSQLISIYYTANFVNQPDFRVSSLSADFTKMKNGDQSLRWVNLNEFDPQKLTFPIDQKVGKMLKIENQHD